jgi:hypothetical protein
MHHAAVHCNLDGAPAGLLEHRQLGPNILVNLGVALLLPQGDIITSR